VLTIAPTEIARAGAIAVALNLTATGGEDRGNLSVWPCHEPAPATSVLNFGPVAAVANMAIVGYGTGGVCIRSSRAVHVVVDVVASFTPHDEVNGITPQRLIDTRRDGPRLRGGEIRRIRIGGSPGIPTAAAAAALNLTVIDPDGDGYAVAFPCDGGSNGGDAPMSSTMNFRRGDRVAGFTIAALSTMDVCVRANVDTDLIVDSFAWMSPEAGLRALDPTRLFDSRRAVTANGIDSETTVRVGVAGRGGVPHDATAVVVTVTTTEATSTGYVTAWSCDDQRPLASVVNPQPNRSRANLTLVGLSNDGGEICLFVKTRDNSPLDLVVDVVGWTPRATSPAPASPGDGSSSSVPSSTTEATAPRANTTTSSSSATVVPHPPSSTTTPATPTTKSTPTTATSASTTTAATTTTTTTTAAATTTTIAPAPSGRFVTLPVGSALPSGAECAARVRPAAEVRSVNTAANNNRGSRANANNRNDWNGFDRVDGNFAGTTDELIQWAACKWGIDEDIARAQIAKESWWHQSANGDNG
jgi:hypothetical protein